MTSFNEQFRFGSARWAGANEIKAAGLFRRKGPQVGFFNRRPLHVDGDAPMITIGGAGSGKLRDLLGYVVCNTSGQRMVILDPRGELGAISRSVHAVNGEHAYFWNPVGLCGLPQHACNPLDILDITSAHFHADCKDIAAGLIPLSGSGTGKYFELRARGWLEAFLKYLAEHNGTVTLAALYRLVNVIQADVEAWTAHLERMLASRFEDVRRTAGEIISKQGGDAEREFGAIVGELYAHLGFLDDPNLLPHLEKPDFSLKEICNPERACKIFLNIPAEHLSTWSPLVRLFFTVAMLYKSREPQSPRVLLLVDEAGQLGRFEALMKAFSYGRGAGVRAWALFQDLGQIIRNYDPSAVQSFMGSATFRQFFGVRDLQTARLVSDMAGHETLYFDQALDQDTARRHKRAVVHRILEGHDPQEAAYDLGHYARASAHRAAQQRKLITPEEVLAMPEDRQVIFLAGKNLPPILGWKFPYYTQHAMAGLYLPNPYHPPMHKVRVRGFLKSKWANVITESTTAFLRTFPQHANGSWSYVEGYKPKF